MNRAHVFGMATLWIAAMISGCGDNNASSMAPISPTAGDGSQTAGVNGTPSAGTGSAAVSGSSGSSGASAGSGVPAVAGSSGSTAGNAGSAAGSGAATAGTVAAIGGSGGAAAGAASPSMAGAAGASPPLDIPAPMPAPLIWGFAIGITDLPAATKFYTDVMKMTVAKAAIKRDDRTDTTLYGTEAMRGARLVLMKFDDMRNTRKITAKLVWQAQSASTVDRAASMYPDYVSRLNFGIVQFDGPETYIMEVGGSFDTGGGSISVPYPIALGFAVSDQPASRKFYTALGMTDSSVGTFSVTDASGTGSITEYSVKFTEGSGVVLQQWSPMRNAKDNPVGMIILVPDAKAMADKVVAAGGTIVKQAERTPAYDNRLLVVAKDLDGYILEIVE
ncbi:MAG TPA: VOC family protein, partial [Polyangiales bacterium]|nr:VOC family protein [Polyangiales bacterium]